MGNGLPLTLTILSQPLIFRKCNIFALVNFSFCDNGPTNSGASGKVMDIGLILLSNTNKLPKIRINKDMKDSKHCFLINLKILVDRLSCVMFENKMI